MIESSTSFAATNIKSANSSIITTINGKCFCGSLGFNSFCLSMYLLYPSMFFVPVLSNSSYLLSISTTIFFKAMFAFLASVTTGASKCGTPLYIESSTFLGSTNTSFTSSGFVRISIDTIKLFIHTDLPDPVDPATSICGVLFICHVTGLPIMSCPNVTRSFFSSSSGLIDSSISLTVTMAVCAFGISIPTVFLPGIGACILTSFAARARAISLFIPSILLSFVPAFISISYCVTAGPT